MHFVISNLWLAAPAALLTFFFRPLRIKLEEGYSRALRKLFRKPTLLFVSKGGTCRDPMAMAITKHLVKGRKPRITVISAGVIKGAFKSASPGARLAIREGLGVDYLKTHRTRSVDQDLVESADLILVMDPKLLDALTNSFPGVRSKTYTLHGFLGRRGEISNPYREGDHLSLAARRRYEKTFQELSQILSLNIDQIYDALVAGNGRAGSAPM